MKTRLNPHSYAHLIFEKCAKMHGGKKTGSSTNGAGKNGYLSAKN
jgi:hypothetical protein